MVDSIECYHTIAETVKYVEIADHANLCERQEVIYKINSFTVRSIRKSDVPQYTPLSKRRKQKSCKKHFNKCLALPYVLL